MPPYPPTDAASETPFGPFAVQAGVDSMLRARRDGLLEPETAGTLIDELSGPNPHPDVVMTAVLGGVLQDISQDAKTMAPTKWAVERLVNAVTAISEAARRGDLSALVDVTDACLLLTEEPLALSFASEENYPGVRSLLFQASDSFLDHDPVDFADWMSTVSARLLERTGHPDLALHLFGLVADAAFDIGQYSDVENEQLHAWLAAHAPQVASLLAREAAAVAAGSVDLHDGDPHDDASTVVDLAEQFGVPLQTAVVVLAEIVATLTD